MDDQSDQLTPTVYGSDEVKSTCATDSWAGVAWTVVGSSPQTSTNACRHVCRYMDQKGLAVMLTSIQSAGVTPEVNLRNLLCAGKEACKRGNPPWLWNPGQTSPKVQNRGISAPTKRTYVLQKLKTKQKKNMCNRYLHSIKSVSNDARTTGVMPRVPFSAF